MNLWNSVQQKFLGVTPIEIKTKEATSLDSWPAANSLLDEIVDATYSSLELANIFRVIWDRLSSPSKHYMHIQKSLTLLEYLILHGSDSVVEQCRTQIYRVRTLKDFSHVNEEGRDIGKVVRKRSKHIVELLTDEDLLVKEQSDAQLLRSRIQGTANANLSGLTSERHARTKTTQQRLERSGSLTREEAQKNDVICQKEDFSGRYYEEVTPVEVNLLDLTAEDSKDGNKKFTGQEDVFDDFFTDFTPKEPAVEQSKEQSKEQSNGLFDDFFIDSPSKSSGESTRTRRKVNNQNSNQTVNQKPKEQSLFDDFFDVSSEPKSKSNQDSKDPWSLIDLNSLTL
ncbi:hypothetical protein P9112_009342 [Eukaryota sp. TZLM1-RC]